MSDQNIVILPADKGRVTVVMDHEDYIMKMMEILDDVDKYRVLSRDQTLKVEKKISSSLKTIHKDGYISDKLLNEHTYRYTESPQMYGLPKVHREGTPVRPIVSTIGSPTYRLTKELARILSPLAGRNSYTVQNSTEFVCKIRGLHIHPEDQLVSFDVTSLFTQVPLDLAIQVLEVKLHEDQSLIERTSIPVPQIVFLTDLCLRSTFFRFLITYS